MILYSAITRGSTILVSHEVGGQNFEGVAKSMLPNIPRLQDTKCSYTSDSYLFHVLVESGITYMCVAHNNFGRIAPFAFLEKGSCTCLHSLRACDPSERTLNAFAEHIIKIKQKFFSSKLALRANSAGTHDFDREFSHILSQEMDKLSRGEGIDQLSKMRAQVNDVTGIMTQNIEKVLARGEKLDTLVDKTADLESNAVVFRGTSKKLHRKMKCKNIKMWLCISAVVAIALTIIILMATNVIPVSNKKKK